MRQYPVEDILLIESARASGTAYPISNRLFWHNGIHIGINGKAPIQCVYNGTISAMRIDKDYQKIDIGDSFSEALLQFHAGDGWGVLQGKLASYFDVSGEKEKTYKLKSGLSAEDSCEAKKLLQCLFSTSFVMVHHIARTIHGTDIEFYSLYLHLRPMKYLSFTSLMGLSWNRLTARASGASYYGIQTYKDEACTIAGTVVPGETIVRPDGKKVTWSLNGTQESGFVKDTNAYRKLDNHYEMKRPTDLEKDDGKRYYASDKFVKKEGILLYSSESAASRTVTGVISGNDRVNVEDAFKFMQRDEALKVSQMEGSKVTQTGWIHLGFPFPVAKAYTGIAYDKNTENAKIDAYVQGGKMDSTCDAYGLEFSCALRDGLTYDSVCTPKDIEIACGMRIGYPGLFAGNAELCHFEIFAPDVGFMEKDKNYEVPSTYIVRTECSAFYGKPHTVEKQATMPWNMQTISTSYVLKLKNGGKPVRVISGENYVEVECVAKKVHANTWIQRDDLPKKNDNGWYHGPKGTEKTATVYMTKDLLFPQNVMIYPDLGYMYEEKATHVTKNAKGKQISVEMRKIREFYEKVSGLPTLLIPKRVFDTCTKEREGLSGVVDITNEIGSDSLLSDISAEQPEQHGIYRVGTSFESEGNEISLYASRMSDTPSSSWIEVTLDGPERRKRYINKSLVYLRKKEKPVCVEKIPYNDWLYFFEKRDSVGKAAKKTSFDDLVKDNDEVLKKLNAAAKDRVNDFGSFVNSDSPCFEYLSSLVYKRATEWKKDDAVTKEIHEDNAMNKPRIEVIRNAACFWDDAKTAASGNPDAVFPKSEVNWYFHPVRFLDHLSKVSIDEVENLKKVQDLVLKLKCLKQGNGGLFPKNYEVTPDQTYCNQAVYLTIRATDMSYYSSFMQNKELQNANGFYDILMQQAAAKVLNEVDGESAQRLANHGYTVVGAWKNPDPKKSGHVVTARPTVDKYISNDGPWVLHIGGKNKYIHAWTAFALSAERSNEIHWFWNQNQQFQFDVGEIYLYE